VKKILSLCAVFIGLVIGAGFASGREIFEYFTLPGNGSLLGIITAGIFFGVLIYIIMNISTRTKIENFEDFIRCVSPKFASVIKAFMNIFMFCGFFIMLSASGTLFASTLKLPFWLGAVSLSALCFTVLSFDLKGLVAANTILVPLMSAGMLSLCVISGLDGVPTFSVIDNLRQSPTAMALCYVSYNTVTAGGVILPLAKGMSRRQMILSALFSTLFLSVLIFAANFTLNNNFNLIFSEEMPLLSIATRFGKLPSYCYAAVLFMALCTTALSYGFSLLQQLHTTNKKAQIVTAAVLCAFALPFSFFGFSTLIANLYAFFGFLGLFWTALIFYRYIKKALTRM